MRSPARFLAALLLALHGCGGGSSSSSTELPLDLTVDDTVTMASVSGWAVELEADGGTVLSASGTAGGQPLSFSVDITGGTTVTPGTPLAVGGSAVNVRLALGETVYRGTEGSLVFSAYGSEPGATVSGTLEIGLVGIVLPKTTARIRADFEADLP
jgi:hypothetical protein